MKLNRKPLACLMTALAITMLCLTACNGNGNTPADTTSADTAAPDTTAETTEAETTAAELLEAPVGQWIEISPDGAMSAAGEPWKGYVRVGKEKNNVIVCFYGGGVALDDLSAIPGGNFYMIDQNAMPALNDGLYCMADINPFKDWTVIGIPYTTGDLHIGTGDYTIKNEAAAGTVVHFNGYNNYRSFMDEAVKYVGKADKLMVTGFSAGGYATALLTDDVITNYFPDAGNTVCFVDSSLTVYENWSDTVNNMWHAPKEIADRITSNDIVLDSLRALSANRPEVKIIYTCSSRDSVLCIYQFYAAKGELMGGAAAANYFQDRLKEFADEFVKLPNSAILIWNDITDTPELGEMAITGHTITASSAAILTKLNENGKTIAEWVDDAFKGELNSAGLELLVRTSDESEAE